jgi:hypothetical protein
MLPYALEDWQRLKQSGGLKADVPALAAFGAVSIIAVYEYA